MAASTFRNIQGGSTEHFPRPKMKRRNEESPPSDTSTPKKRKPRLAVKQGVPSNRDLEWLSQKLERWKIVGRRLNIEEERLTAFDKKNCTRSEKIYEMLFHWKERDGSAATYTVLHDALCHPLVSRRDLAEEFWAYSNLHQFTTVKHGIPSDGDLEWLSQKLERWKTVGRLLKIEEARLMSFDIENYALSEKNFKMLLHWKERNGSAATYMVLHDALCDPSVNRRDLAEQLEAYSNLHQFTTDPIPYYIKARGTMGLEAYRRALEIGETFDRRTKIALIGQDRVGKTSLRRYLRGEPFDKDEASTPGIQMISPVENAGTGVWKNPVPLENTSPIDHKWAEVVAKELLSSPKKIRQSAQPLPGEGKKKRGQPTSGKRATQKPSNGLEEVKSERKPEEVPEKVLSLVDRALHGNDTADNEGIWPFVWDFAGQAVYHAIHPIFLSQEAIHVLVSDLTKELSAPAQCRTRPLNHDEVEVNSPYAEDTNLDHMIRWLDLVHSLGRPEFQRKSANTNATVVLVGTHADDVKDPWKEMESVMGTICRIAHPATLGHISKESFFIDNKNPNRKDDPQIVSLRAELLDLAKKMPHINELIPMQWLYVEQKVNEMVKEEGMHHVGKKRFTEEICEGICQFNDTDDVEELLHFLQARGRVIYQDLPDNPDGLVVLDPQWLMQILCKIITVSPPWKNDPLIQRDYQVLGREGLLSQQLLNRAFEHLELNDIRNPLIHIMESFDVICNSMNCKGEDYPYLVPFMLKSPKKNTKDTNMLNGPLPVFLTFNTSYVPIGLFCRLVVHFWKEWASQLCRDSRMAPSLFSNAARFNVSEVYQLTLECHKTVIKLIIWTQRDSDGMEEKRICEELLSLLERCRTRLSVTCPWLRSSTMELYVKCQLCEPCPDKCRDGTNICILHKEKGCSHFDCGHYIPLGSSGLSCEHSVYAVPDYPREKLDPWVQALKSMERKKRTGGRNEKSSPCVALTLKKRKTRFAGASTKHLRWSKVKRRYEESSPSDALTSKKRKTGFAGGSMKHLRWSKVKRRNEESSPSDALTSKKRKTGFSGASTKHLRWSKVKRRYEESSPSDALTSKKRKTGFAGGSTKHLPRPKVKRRNEELSPSDALTSKKRKSGFAGGSTKHLRRSKVKRRNEESSPSVALTSKKRKTGFAGGSTKHLPRPKVKRRDEESSPCDALTPNKRKSGFAVKQGVLSDEDLQWLSHELIKWRDLGFRLKIREATLKEIDHDHSEKREKINEMLKSWTQTNGAAATYMVLHDALCHPLVGRTDLAEKFCCQPHE